MAQSDKAQAKIAARLARMRELCDLVDGDIDASDDQRKHLAEMKLHVEATRKALTKKT